MNLPPGPFGCILADPPWAFNTYSGKLSTPHRGAHDHYVTTTTADLAEIPVADVALVGGPRLELFARSARPGWSAWGNEVGARDGLLFGDAA